MIRIKHFDEKIQIRTIYDHIISLALTADCLMPSISHGIYDSEIISLSKCIAYHDLCEALLGDIPQYTNLPKGRRQNARIEAERLLRKTETKKREFIANEFLSLFLENKDKENIEFVTNMLSKSKNRTTDFFTVLDKIDPIISIWRYIHCYRDSLNGKESEFLRRLKDFFENQNVLKVTEGYVRDPKIKKLILPLQNEKLALDYYHDPGVIQLLARKSGFNFETLKYLLEGIPIFHSQKIYNKK